MEIQKLSPLMQQYWDIKNQHLDKILLFRMGDFYEMFFDDAVKAAPLLNIALTSRNKSQGQDVPMCGVPYHSIGPQINKLLNAGIKVAICDQIESPKDAKTIVKRAVTRIVTPGLVYDPETLDGSESLYVASILGRGEGAFDFAALDASTGEVIFAQNLDLNELSSWIQKLSPKEYVVEINFKFPFPLPLNAVWTKRPTESSTQSVENFLLSYVKETQGEQVIKTLRPPEGLQKDFLKISPTTMRHLEILKTSTGEKLGSLFETINFTKTAMGSRLLKKRLITPFAELQEILKEQSRVEAFYSNHGLRQSVREALSASGDLERKVARLSNSLCNARDLQALAQSLKFGINVIDLVGEKQTLKVLAQEICSKINERLQDELPSSTKDGSMIRPGFNQLLDELVDLATHSQTKLSELETKEKTQSGIQSLKVKYNSVFGYSFEVTKANLNRVPEYFIRRQTLAQAERFVTQALVELEEKILSSQQKRSELEFKIFDDLKNQCLSHAQSLLELSHFLATVDLQASWAQLALEQNYCKPEFNQDRLVLKESRHVVLERLSRDPFIPNDISMAPGECILLTGPNMAGKSTLMRQVALTAILAQCGSYVPAKSAQLPLFDQIFTRIGASDHLVQGLSTFMVEMTETAEIIRSATTQSLVILDEIGRGTSTYDGMSLAQAVLEYFVKNTGSYTLFATHYHELTELEKDVPGISNWHMSIQEHQGSLVFLRKLVPGAASRSYGIEVAKLAGLPKDLIVRAQIILKGITTKTKELKNKQLDLLSGLSSEQENEMEYLRMNWQTLQDSLKGFREIKVETLTPLEALNHLAALQKSFQ